MAGQEFYIEAFDRLTTCRYLSDGVVGRIPWTALREYANTYEMDFESFKTFEAVIEKMDQAYVRWVKDKAKDTTDG